MKWLAFADSSPLVSRHPLSYLGAGVFAIAAGCAVPDSSKQIASDAQGKPTINQPTEIPTKEVSDDPGDSKALASVMDFLDRTSDYGGSTPADGKSAGAPRKRGDGSTVHHKPEIPTIILPGDTEKTASAPTIDAAKQPAPAPVQANAQLSLVESTSGRPAAAPTVKSLRIRTADAGANTPTTTTTLNATNQAIEIQPADQADGGKALLSTLAKKARTEPGFENEWALRMAQAAMNEPVEVDAIGKSLPDEQRRIITGTAALLSAIRHEAVNPQLPGEEALLRASDLSAVLAERADPVVTTIALCRRVVTFGAYEEMPAAEFVAGRATPTIVYSEIRNLRSDKGGDGLYRSVLSTRMELFTADGQSVWKHEEPEITDLCRNRRSDFFVAQRVTLPATLKEGPHVLKVLVDDKQSGRAAEQSFRFNVSGTAVAKSK